MPRQPRVHVLSPHHSPDRTEWPSESPAHRPAGPARTPPPPVVQQGLPLDALTTDQMGFVVQRQNRALRRQEVQLHSPQTNESLPVVLRVPLPTTVPQPLPSAVEGNPVLPHSEREAFIQEHIAPRLPAADYPPAPPLDKRKQPARPGISYLFHEDDTATTSGRLQSISLAPTSVVYGPGCSYLSLDSRTAIFGAVTLDVSLGMTEAEMQSPPLMHLEEVGTPSYADAAKADADTESSFPLWVDPDVKPRADISSITTPTKGSRPSPVSRAEMYLWALPDTADGEMSLAATTSEATTATTPSAEHHPNRSPYPEFSVTSSVDLSRIATVVDLNEGGARGPHVRRVMRTAPSEVSLAGAEAFGGVSEKSRMVANISSLARNDDNISF